MSRRSSMNEELVDLLLQYGALTRQRAAVDLLSTCGEADAARRKCQRMEERHAAACARFLKRWGGE